MGVELLQKIPRGSNTFEKLYIGDEVTWDVVVALGFREWEVQSDGESTGSKWEKW